MRPAEEYELRPAYSFSDDEPRGAGWVMFAAVMLGVAGTWNVIQGLLAIADSRVYGASHVFVFSDLNTWGWIVMILGLGQILAALAIFSGSEFARWFGVAVASLNAIGQLMFVPIYPWWAIAMFSVDVLIIYALAAYGGHRLRQDL